MNDIPLPEGEAVQSDVPLPEGEGGKPFMGPPEKGPDPTFGEKAVNLGKANAKNLLSFADLIGSAPAALVGTMADAGFRVRGIVKGEDRRTIGKEGNIAFQTAMEEYGSPFSKLMHLAGFGRDEEAPTGVDSLMQKATKLLEKGGDWVEQHTGGAIQKEDVESITNEVLALAGGKGMAHGMNKLGGKLAARVVDGMKTVPEAEQAGAYKAAQESKDPAAPHEMAEQGAQAATEAAVAKVRMTAPKDLVLDPVTGDLSEAVPEPGKELPKPTSLETGLDKVAGGRRFDMTAEERIAMKGLNDAPLEQPIIDESGAVIRRGGRFNSEAGSIDPKLMSRLAAVGLGAWAGAYFSDDDKLQSAVLGGAAALGASMIPGKKALEVGKFLFGKDTRLRISDVIDAQEKGVDLGAIEVWSRQKAMEKLVPDPKRLEALTHAVEKGDVSKFSPAEQQAAKIWTDYREEIAQQAKAEGVLDTVRDNYISHIWDWGENKSAFQKWWDKQSGSGMGSGSSFTKERTIPTIEEGKLQGLTPKTENLSTIMGIYGNSMTRAIVNSKFTKALKLEKDPFTGKSLVIAAEDAPHSYVTINSPFMRGLKIHPDIAPSLKLLYDTSEAGKAMKVMLATSDSVKKMAVSFSLFHAKALTDAMIAGTSNPIMMIGELPGMAAGAEGVKWGPLKIAGSRFLQELRKGSASQLVRDAVDGGLKFSLEATKSVVGDTGNGYYEVMDKVSKELDKVIPHLGAPVKAVRAVTEGLDTLMWPRLHTGMKLSVFSKVKEKFTANIVKSGKNLTSAQINRIAASYTNDLFGGLNWRRIAEGAQSRFGRELGQALLTPSGQRVMSILMFAPDWTVSTTRAAFKAFTGRPDFINPTTLAGLHQQYLLRAAVYYLIVGDAINHAMSGHHIWENKDWSVLDMDPKGETHMQWSKHTMEPVHWLMKPRQQAINKLGFIPREVTEQVLGKEYLSASGQSPSMDGRLKHLAQNFVPIAGKQGGVKGALSGFAGVPIYGKTSEEKAKDKAERARKKREDARKKGRQ